VRAELGRGPVTVTTVVPGLMRTGSHLQAVRRRRAEIILTPAGQLVSRAAGIVPGLTSEILHLVQRLASRFNERR
jgi:NAD(P)-dependent dehydrogenase (short-subunit alcohol dehydrogenase family)